MSTGINIASSSGLTVGTTAVTSGTNGRVFFQAGGVVQQSDRFTFDNTTATNTLQLGAGANLGVSLRTIAPGATSSDIAYRVRNSADTENIFEILGTGKTQLCKFGNGVGYAMPNTVGVEGFLITTENASVNPAAFTRSHVLLNSTEVWIRGATDNTARNVVKFGAENYGGTFVDWSIRSIALNDGALYFNGGTSTASMRMFLTDSATLNIGKNSMLNVNSGTNQLRILNGTAPSSLAADTFALYSADITTGNAAPHFRTENGSIIKLYQNTAVTTPQGIADALTNLGVLATSTIAPSVQSVTSAATVTPANGNDLVIITAQAVGLTLANPTGTWSQGKDLMIRILDNGSAQTIAYDTKYRAIGVTLPTTTTAGKTTYLGVIYNATDDKFDVIGVTTQA